MAHKQGFGRSNGCAYADSPYHVPIQRMPNVSLQPSSEDISLDDLIGGVDRGIYVVGDGSWSIDMQRYNFQFGGQRFYAIENGKLGRPAQGRRLPRHDHGFLGCDGSGRRKGQLRPRRRVQLRQRTTRPGGAGVARVSAGIVPWHQRPEHEAGARIVTRVAELVDRALSLSQADGCIVLGRESSQANVRWANNTSTTNGVIASSGLTVISIRDGRVGSVSRSYVPDDELEALVRTSEAACEGRPKAEDEMPLVEGGADAGIRGRGARHGHRGVQLVRTGPRARVRPSTLRRSGALWLRGTHDGHVVPRNLDGPTPSPYAHGRHGRVHREAAGHVVLRVGRSDDRHLRRRRSATPLRPVRRNGSRGRRTTSTSLPDATR